MTPTIREMEEPAPIVKPRPTAADTPACDQCGGETWWRSCKLLCKQCRAIVMSCGDL